MFKKNRVEILKNGKWEPVEKEIDVKKISALFFALSLVAATTASLLWVYKSFFNQKKASIQSANKPEAEEYGRHLVGVFSSDDVQYLADNDGNLYGFEDNKILFIGKKAVKLNEKETLVAINSNGAGENLLGINNEENENLIKFLSVTGEGKVIEEKVVYNSRLQSKSFNNGLFITTNDQIIWRKEGDKYYILASPLDQEAVSDIFAATDYIYVLGQKDSILRIRTASIESGQTDWEKLVQGNSDGEKNGTNPFFLQVFKDRLVIISNDRTLEEWVIKNNRAELKSFKAFQKVVEKKPDFLAAFELVNLKNAGLPESWCLTGNERTRCVDVMKEYKVYKHGNRSLIIGQGESFWTIKF